MLFEEVYFICAPALKYWRSGKEAHSVLWPLGVLMSFWEKACMRLWMDVRFLSSSVFFLFVFVWADFSSYIVLFVVFLC